jgi:hypothetical protein
MSLPNKPYLSGLFLDWNLPRGSEVVSLGATVGLGPASTFPVGCSLRLEPTLSSNSGTVSLLSYSGGGYSSL